MLQCLPLGGHTRQKGTSPALPHLGVYRQSVCALNTFHLFFARRICAFLAQAFFTLQPPDRVGVVRRLRLGISIYVKKGDDKYTVDLSRMKHKTTRFYGPVISSLPLSIGEWVARYEESLVFELTGNPFIFAMSSNYERGLSSSAWTQVGYAHSRIYYM